MARETIDDVVRAGRVVAANAMIMSTSVAQFPVVRASNLAALEAIQASTMSITEPAARLAAEQAAVATFVSTQLQPSLELLKPPVANLGVPVLGHTGGGVLEAASVGQGRERVEVSTIAGNPGGPAASIGNGGMGAESNAAANAAGRGTEAAVQTAGAQPAAVQANPASGAPQQVSALTASHGGTGTGVTGNLVTQPAGVNTAIDNGRGVGVGANIHNQPAHSRTATGQVGHLSAGAPTGGGAPGSFFGRGFSGTGMGRGGHPTQNIGSGSGNQRLPQLPLQAQQAALAKEAAFKAGTGSQAGMMGAAGAPGRGGAMGGMASGGHKGRGGGAGRAALFSYSKEDKEYFKRLFLGGIVRPEGKRTVRRVITRG
ncbi:MAG TPA: hypothetical protein H9867_00975 [Candidatus Corynebacterium gallistercoris]|uniref:Uncharacterized protein n=1 Tax=Candidatus Corynebacterium gallistercoris TaxID=2838530 RepID=A0A9D1UP98_9CORY|nr:hypothetical protein [Candidatus Corynebacterium gallistercoris]